MKHVVAAVLATCAAGPVLAQAGCPVAADLARGITIELANGGTEVYRQSAPGVVSVAGRDPDGSTYAMELGQGFHLLMWEVPGDPSSRLTYDYGMAFTALPVPVANGRWQTPVRVNGIDGARSEPQVHTYGPMVPVTIGNCTYDSFEGQIAYETSDNYVESIVYIPALGIGYLLWNESTEYARDPLPAVGIRAGK